MSSPDDLMQAIQIIGDSFGENFDAENFSEMVQLTRAYHQDRQRFRSILSHRDDDQNGRTHLVKSVRSGNITWAKKLLQLLDSIDSYTIESTQFIGKECYICYDPFEENHIVYKVPCRGKHIFHKDCIDRWVQVNSSCPYCRDPISLEDITAFLNKTSHSQKNVLYYAIKIGNVPFVEELIQKGAMVQYRNASPLHLAAGFNHTDLITYFLAKGASIESKDAYGNTPLYYAACYSSPTTLKCLLDNSANPFFAYYNEQADEKEENTLLHVAVQHYNRQSIEYIVDYMKQKGISIDAKDSNNHTPLQISILKRHYCVMKQLIDLGADISTLSNDHPLYCTLRTEFDVDEPEGEEFGMQRSFFGTMLRSMDSVFAETQQPYLAFLSDILLRACKIREMNHAKYLLLKYSDIEIHPDCFDALSYDHHLEFFTTHGLLDKFSEYPEFVLCCVERNNLAFIQKYIEKGKPLNLVGKNGNTLLHMVKSDEMFALLKDVCDIHQVNAEGNTVLHSLLGDYSTVMNTSFHYTYKFEGYLQFLNSKISSFRRQVSTDAEEQEEVVEVEVDDDDEYVPPVPVPKKKVVCTKKTVRKKLTVEPIRLLLSNGIPVNAKNKKGLTPLQIVAHVGNVELAKLLLEHGANLHECSDYKSPLHIAMLKGCHELVHLFISEGADIHRLYDGESVLHYAIENESEKVLECACLKGANLNMKNEKGQTAFGFAFLKSLQEGSDALWKYMALKGADVNQPMHQDVSGNHLQFSLSAAVVHGDATVFQYLVSHGGDIHLKDSEGMSLIHLAAQFGRLEILHYLLEKGLSVNALSTAGYTPMQKAMDTQQLEAIKVLLYHGAIINSKDPMGQTILHYAALSDLEGTKLCLEKGADVNVEDIDGDTPLMNAVANHETEIVKLLLQHGASIHAQNKEGATAFSVCKNAEIQKLLEEHMKIEASPAPASSTANV